jgi:hypothetical protein
VENNRSRERGFGTATFTILALVLIGTGVFWYMRWADARRPQMLELTPEAKQYVHHLQLSDVEIKAHESYMKQLVVEIHGKIGNGGDRTLKTVDLNCVFYDGYGEVILRERVSIVTERAGGLAPGETKPFRLPFDNLPDTWNHRLPQLVIAGIRF